MQKPNLKLGFTDTFDNCKLFFTDILSRRYNVIRDDNTPDYLIFGDPNFGQNHVKFDKNKVTKIFYTGENVRPDYWGHDYAITFDFENSLRHFRLPLYVMEMWAVVNDDKWTADYNYLQDLHDRIDWDKEHYLKTENISYIQSNPNCGPRNSFVEKLQKHMKVNCGGPHLNNIGYVVPRNRQAKMDFLTTHKMNIAFENGSYDGYTTEKLLDAFYSHTLPIYWGNYMVSRDFNTNSFIQIANPHGTGQVNVNEYMLDIYMNDKKAWVDKMSQPRFNFNITNEYTQLDNFLNWFGENVYHG